MFNARTQYNINLVALLAQQPLPNGQWTPNSFGQAPSVQAQQQAAMWSRNWALAGASLTTGGQTATQQYYPVRLEHERKPIVRI